jgi:anti-sigma regulatory factor (Ser/Thr protein kinase)
MPATLDDRRRSRGRAAPVSPTFEAGLPRNAIAARLARGMLDDRFAAELDRPELDAGKLVATELVNNAMIHGQGRITMRADLDRDRLRVDVADEGSGFATRKRAVGFDKLAGLGLRIVAAASSRWGVLDGTAQVWFEVDRGQLRLS